MLAGLEQVQSERCLRDTRLIGIEIELGGTSGNLATHSCLIPMDYPKSCGKCLTNSIAIGAEPGKRCGAAVGVIRCLDARRSTTGLRGAAARLDLQERDEVPGTPEREPEQSIRGRGRKREHVAIFLMAAGKPERGTLRSPTTRAPRTSSASIVDVRGFGTIFR